MKIVTIGRLAGNTIVIQDNLVSRQHAQITQNPNGEVIVEDLNSSNGTFVNGNKVSKHILKDNDILQIGNTVIDWKSYFGLPTQPTVLQMQKPVAQPQNIAATLPYQQQNSPNIQVSVNQSKSNGGFFNSLFRNLGGTLGRGFGCLFLIVIVILIIFGVLNGMR